MNMNIFIKMESLTKSMRTTTFIFLKALEIKVNIKIDTSCIIG